MKRILIIVATLMAVSVMGFLIFRSPGPGGPSDFVGSMVSENSPVPDVSGAGSADVGPAYTAPTYAGVGREGKVGISYPDGFTASEVNVDAGMKKVIVESPAAEEGFEVTIMPFDESAPLTAKRIKRDLPNIVILNAENVKIGENGDLEAITFNSTDENIGLTYEVWFVYGGSLYQVTTYSDFSGQMAEILETWKFR